ncbi:MAG TPA: ABC transporter ATP-binding protein [Chthoniobacterales bacterium]
MSSTSKTKNKKRPGFLKTIKQGVGPMRKLLPYLRPYRRRFILGLALGGAFGATSGLLALVLQQVLALVPGGTASRTAILKHVSETNGPRIDSVIWLCAAIPLVMIVRSLFSYFNGVLLSQVGLKVISDIREHLFRHVMRQSLDYFHKNKSGDLISRVYNDPRMAQMALSTVSADLVTQPIAILSSVGVLIYLDWKFAIISLCVFPICLLPVIYFGKRVKKSGGNEEDSASGMMVILQESFAGIRVIKALAREVYQRKLFRETNLQQVRQSIGIQKTIQAVSPLVEVVAALGAGVTIFYVWFEGISAATFMAMLTCLFTLYDPVKKLSMIHMVIQRSLGGMTRIFQMLEEEPTVSDKPDAVAVTECRGAIRFENVSFAYRKDKKAVKNLSFEFEAGKYYALVGASGAGKSTILSLILRFYDPAKGRITLDGRDLRDVTQASLREHIGVVTQDTFLFHDTILNNIRYGRLDATDEEVTAAAKLAYANNFILEQAKGYDTVVGDKGCNISGGQQQRLAIARALLKNAPILLLDEATSALDSESEQMIQAALERLVQGRTVIAIAHRLSTILKADKILVMENGELVEVGSHQELLSESTVYRRLYNIQFNQAGEQPAELAMVD